MEIVNGYKIKSILGKGGFGETYLAESPTNHPVALKKIHPSSDISPSILRQMFEREAKALRQLGSHPQIPDFIEYFEDEGCFYLAQEYIEGKPLKIAECWTRKEALAFLDQMLPLLSFMHDRGYLHRDIKPENILRQHDGKLILVDFGAAKINYRLDVKGTAIGTPGYMPLEQELGKPKPGSDLYSLGIIAVQGLLGIGRVDELKYDRNGNVDWHYSDPHLYQFLKKMTQANWRFRYRESEIALIELYFVKQGNYNKRQIYKAKKKANHYFASARQFVKTSLRILEPLAVPLGGLAMGIWACHRYL